MIGTGDWLLFLAVAAAAPSIVRGHPGGAVVPRLYGRNGVVDLDSLPQLVKRAPSPDGTCGGTNAYTCPGGAIGNCCSRYGWCGSTDAYCLPANNCQPAFGICSGGAGPTTTPPTPPTTTTPTPPGTSSTHPISPNLRCGPLNGGYSCPPTANRCCSQNGWCGDSDAHCLVSQNCQLGYGVCTGAVPPTTTTPTTPATTPTTTPTTTTPTTAPTTTTTSPAHPISPNLRCGPLNGGYACPLAANKCCSQNGWCGDTDAHCQLTQNCQPEYGVCAGTATTTAPGTGTSTSPTGSSRPISPNGQCGSTNGYACPASQCCSLDGTCGTSEDYCSSPDCQMTYGKCDSDTTPAGASTENIARPLVGSFPYGTTIFDCAVPGDIALTFDDGPWIFTDALVTLLKTFNARATFFITGINSAKGAIDTTSAWRAVIQRMAADNHQLASHTWSHANLDLLTDSARRTEMIKLEMAMRNIVGYFPTYMRPPYSACGTACLQTMRALGYHVTSFNIDTDDYNQDAPNLIQTSKNIFASYVNPSNPNANSFLVIAHDTHQQTTQNLTSFMLTTLANKGYRAVTVGECLGDPKANWYRSA